MTNLPNWVTGAVASATVVALDEDRSAPSANLREIIEGRIKALRANIEEHLANNEDAAFIKAEMEDIKVLVELLSWLDVSGEKISWGTY